MKATHRYLRLPIRTGAPKRPVRIPAAQPYTCEVEIAEGAADFESFVDIDGVRGSELDLEIGGARQADTPVDDERLYREPLRPQFHFSSMRGWNNDPNGLLWHAGEWHLFYQHNPFGTAWGNMHWGHAVSTDLVRWRELGEALAPDRHGAMYSGSGVVDRGNTSGLARGSEPPLVLLYTAAGGKSPESQGERFAQALAWSTDRGRSWSKLGPVLPHVAAENRDPKVVWHGPSARWVMALYIDGDEYALFSSPDLKSWQPLQRLPLQGARECPDLFEIGGRWVFWGANGRYLVGSFDGGRFEATSGPHTLSYGSAYAAQTWSGAPGGRLVQIAWLRGEKPGEAFNQQMTFPCELALRDTPEGPRLAGEPVAEIATLVAGCTSHEAARLDAGSGPLRLEAGELLDVGLEAGLASGTAFEITLRGLAVSCDAGRATMACGGHQAPLPLRSGRLDLRALVDRSSLELYAAGGLAHLALPLVPAAADRAVSLRVLCGRMQAVRLAVRTLRSAWGR